MELAVVTPYTVHKIDMRQDFERYDKALAIRKAVFLEEQNIVVVEDWRKVDGGFSHFVALNEDTEEIIASARLGEVAQGCQTQPVAKIEWIAVLPEYRKQGIGKQLVTSILADIRVNHYQAAYLQANIDSVGFYESLGFKKEGFAFEEGGITYYAMRCII